MNFENTLVHLDSIRDSEIARYKRHLTRMKPSTPEDIFRRWLFAYASVHTTWKLNCKLYYALRGLEWLGDKEALKRNIVGARAGFHNRRADYIYDFSQYYWEHPDWFRKSKHENWYDYRNRIERSAKGIGHAKGAFVVEMTYPLEAQVVCVDTHILQMYGFTPAEISNPGVKRQDLNTVEKHWVTCCNIRGVPPTLARWLYWDRKQGHSDSRYWSYLFEEEDYYVRLAKIASSSE